MKNAVFYTLLLSILNSILFYNQDLGLNVILFTLPFLIFLFYYLKLNKLIKNKKGLLIFIPIIFLSSTYFIYNNSLTTLNIFIIPILYILMFLYTINPTTKIESMIKRIIKVIGKPFDYIDDFFKEVKEYGSEKVNLSDDKKKKIKSILIVVPIIITVLYLLSSADMIFQSMFINISKVFQKLSLSNLIGRLILIVLLFIYLGSTLSYLSKQFFQEEESEKKIPIEEYTMKLLLTILNIIYIIFDVIQIHSLLLHRVTENINYAEYARTGFFQLMAISILNLIILLVSKKSKETKYNKIMSLIMIGLTLIIMISSFYRMYLYEQAYGYTVLRLGVSITLITEAILLIPTIVYIFNSKINILNYYVVIVLLIYSITNIFSVDKVIAENNIRVYQNEKKIDISYLTYENDNYDNIPQLLDFYQKCEDEELKEELKDYLTYQKEKLKKKKNNIFSYSISRNNAYLELKKKFKN